MIPTTAAALAVSGAVLITLAILGLRQPKQHHYIETTPHCEAPSPDDNLHCTEEIGHYGWHRHGATSWFGDAWDCDEYADTQAAPTLKAPEPKPEPAPSVPIKPHIPSTNPHTLPCTDKDRRGDQPDGYYFDWSDEPRQPLRADDEPRQPFKMTHADKIRHNKSFKDEPDGYHLEWSDEPRKPLKFRIGPMGNRTPL